MDPDEDLNNDPGRQLLRRRGYQFCDDRENAATPVHIASAVRCQEEARCLENLVQEGVNASSTDHVSQSVGESTWLSGGFKEMLLVLAGLCR